MVGFASSWLKMAGRRGWWGGGLSLREKWLVALAARPLCRRCDDSIASLKLIDMQLIKQLYSALICNIQIVHGGHHNVHIAMS